jgi:hypothetical protein
MATRARSYLASNVLGLIAIFIALGAGAYAAGLPKNSVNSKQIKAGAVKTGEIADDAVTSPKVADGSLLGQDFAAGQLPAADTPQQVLDKVKDVDGPGSGADADLLDGNDANDFLKGAGTIPGGSDLSGSYASPQIAAGTINTRDLAPSLQIGTVSYSNGSFIRRASIIDVSRAAPGVFCFSLAYTPTGGVATISADASGFPVAYTLESPPPSLCPTSGPHTFAVVTYNTAASGGVRTDEPFYAIMY